MTAGTGTVNQPHQIRDLEIGATLGRAFALIGRHPLKTFGLALLVGALPMRALSYCLQLEADSGTRAGAVNLQQFFCYATLQTIIAGLLVGGVIFDGRPAINLRRLPQLAAVGFLNALGQCIAAICLLVPYLFVVTRWSVVGAVAAGEEVGINAAFGRSSELTEGARLRIFGVILASGVGQTLLLMLGIVALIPIVGQAKATQDFSSEPLVFAVQLLCDMLNFGFAASLQCALYAALREGRHGPFTGNLSEIFA